jgi:AraC-like DNA-binding protein
MTIVYESEAEPLATRFDGMRDLFDSTLPIDFRLAGDREERRVRVMIGEIGAITVMEAMSNVGVRCARTAKLIDRLDPGVYQLMVIKRGTMRIESGDGRRATLGPGDFSLIDPSRRGAAQHTPGGMVKLLFPRALLPLAQTDVERLTVKRIPGDKGAGALVSSLARQLPSQLDDHDAEESARLGTAVIDLLAVALGAQLGGNRVSSDTEQRALLLRIRTHIEERLADPELSPRSIATAHHISLRQLHRLFESQEATVAESIRRRRLERSRKDLLDPALLGLPVEGIARRWGFEDAAHFSRAFRATYGLPPGRFRATHSVLSA